MATAISMSGNPLWRGLRWVVLGGAAVLLSLPAVAMWFGVEGVVWTAADFVVMGVMLGLVCVAFEVAVRVARSHAYVVAAGLAVAVGFLTTWSNLAVGIIGNEDNPVNLVFFGVSAVALVGAAFARLRPSGMARAMVAAAVAQAAACVAALVLDGARVFVITGVFLAMWLLSALLFRKAGREEGGIA